MPHGLEHRQDGPFDLDRAARTSARPGLQRRNGAGARFPGEALDVNCNQHIQQRFKPDEIESVTAKFMERARELKQENESLRSIVKGRSGVESIKKESAA